MNARIMLVDDHYAVRRSLTRALTTAGFDVRSFASAEGLLEVPDLDIVADCLLIDVHLSGMTGIELCRALRVRGVTIPKICMSADHQDSLRAAALKAGAIACLLKPFDTATLLEQLDRVLPASRRA
jgi:FixJ family two-component response regulator